MTGEKTKNGAVTTALREFVGIRKLKELRALAGNIDLDVDLDEMERLEMEEQEKLRW